MDGAAGNVDRIAILSQQMRAIISRRLALIHVELIVAPVTPELKRLLSALDDARRR